LIVNHTVRVQHIISLQSARKRLPLGSYACELVESFLGENPVPADRADAGDLFRSLMLDEHWSKEDAAIVYYSALAVLDARAGLTKLEAEG
jgi:hypothetical protein